MIDVCKHVTAAGRPDFCFDVFTKHLSRWWPPTHKLVPGRRTALVLEPWVGGSYFELDEEGNRRDWGKVLEWEPPKRLLLSWAIDGRWQPVDDDDRASRIEVRFTRHGWNKSIVELSHIALHRHGADAERIFSALDGPSPGETLERFEAACEDLMSISKESHLL